MPPATYRFGPFLVDRASYRVLRGEHVVDLTPKLLDLLLHLVDHAGTLVTKEELLDALWPGANVTDNALAQAVSDCAGHRRRCRDMAYIKTVARRGYRFIARVDAVESGGSAGGGGAAVDQLSRLPSSTSRTSLAIPPPPGWRQASPKP